MSCSNNDDNDKKIFGLLLKKRTEDSLEEIGLTIYNINDLTDNELKHLVQNFFENDDDVYSDKFGILCYCRDNYIFDFTLKNKKYNLSYFGEKKNDFKESIIKFLNFLKNIMVEVFYCISCDFDDDVDIINLIGNVIKNSKAIEHVSFPRSYLINNAFKILYDYLSNHESLKCLDFGFFSKQKMSDNCIEYFDKIIKTSNIEDVVGLHNDDYNYFFESLLDNFFRGKNPNLKLKGKNINDDQFLKLSNLIINKKVNYLKEIDLSGNIITSKGFSMLVDSLLDSKNENIIKINFGYNKLNDDCIEILRMLMKKNENIRCINFNNNYITDKGVEELSKYIIGNIFIIKIDLSHNDKITNSSFETIKNIINSSEIVSFEIYGTQINEKLEAEIIELLKIPINQREIPLITIKDVKSASKIMKE